MATIKQIKDFHNVLQIAANAYDFEIKTYGCNGNDFTAQILPMDSQFTKIPYTNIYDVCMFYDVKIERQRLKLTITINEEDFEPFGILMHKYE